MITNIDVTNVMVSQIRIGPRLRKDLGDIDSLAKSMTSLGLLQPIIITKDMWLLAGERRLTAAKSLDWEKIPAMILPFNHSGALA
jgi:ParB family chromosome partitioning protein